MTLLYTVVIEDEVHRVRVETPGGEPQEGRPTPEQLAITTAWLEHKGLLPRGVPNAYD